MAESHSSSFTEIYSVKRKVILQEEKKSVNNAVLFSFWKRGLTWPELKNVSKTFLQHQYTKEMFNCPDSF